MKLKYRNSGVIVVVPNGTAYDAAMFEEVAEAKPIAQEVATEEEPKPKRERRKK